LAQTPPPAKRAAKPAAAAVKPNAYDGTWRAVSSQKKDLMLVIKDDRVAEVSFGYTIPGGKCFPVGDGSGAVAYLPELNNSIRFSLNPEHAPKVKGNQVAVERSEGSGGPNAAPLFDLNGKFGADGTLTGTLDLVALGALHPPEKPCRATAKATFKGRPVKMLHRRPARQPQAWDHISRPHAGANTRIFLPLGMA